MAQFAKSSQAVFQERIAIVMEMLLSGLNRRDIIQNVSKNDNLKWNVVPRQIDNYIAAANKEILSQYDKEKENLINKVFSRYEFLYKKHLNVKDYKGATIVLKEMAAFTGIAAAVKVNLGGQEDNPIVSKLLIGFAQEE